MRAGKRATVKAVVKQRWVLGRRSQRRGCAVWRWNKESRAGMREAVQRGGVVLSWRKCRSIDMEGAWGATGISGRGSSEGAWSRHTRVTARRDTRGLSLPEDASRLPVAWAKLWTSLNRLARTTTCASNQLCLGSPPCALGMNESGSKRTRPCVEARCAVSLPPLMQCHE